MPSCRSSISDFAAVSRSACERDYNVDSINPSVTHNLAGQRARECPEFTLGSIHTLLWGKTCIFFFFSHWQDRTTVTNKLRNTITKCRLHEWKCNRYNIRKGFAICLLESFALQTAAAKSTSGRKVYSFKKGLSEMCVSLISLPAVPPVWGANR